MSNCFSLSAIRLILSMLLTFSSSYAIYYRIPLFARTTALGEALVSVPGDASSIYYNPAGINSRTISFSLTEWFLDTRAVSCAGSYKYKNYFNIGAGISYFSYGQMDYIDEQGNTTGKFSASFTQARLGLSKQYKMFSIGLATKLFDERIETNSKTKVGIDGGMLVSTKIFNIGIGIQDLIIRDQILVDCGVSVRPVLDLLIASDFNFQEKMAVKIGLEYYYQPLFLRVGYGNSKVSIGLGYKRNNFTIDYAVNSHNKLGLTHLFSITIQ